MNDVKALAEWLRDMAEDLRQGLTNPVDADALDEAADALEASVQAPAVDHEALIAEARMHLNGVMKDDGDSYIVPTGDIASVNALLALLADALEASVQDAWEVEARGLERLIERVTEPGLVQTFGGERFVSVALLVSEARAQQVREGNA